MSEDKKKFVELMVDELKEIKAGMPYEKPSIIDFESAMVPGCDSGAGGCGKGSGGCTDGGGCGSGSGCNDGGVPVPLLQ